MRAPAQGEGGDGDRKASWVDWVRRTVAAGVLGLGSLVALDAIEVQHCGLKEIRDLDEVVETERTCTPLDAGDLTPLYVLAGVLLLPDVAEVEFPGVITLRRKLREQEIRQDRIEQQVVGLTQTVSQRLSLSVNVAPELAKAERRVDRLATAFIDPPALSEARGGLRELATGPARGADIASRVKSIADRLNELIAASEPDSTESLSPDEARTLRRWREVFAREIATVEAVGDRLHDEPGPTLEELERAERLGDKLLDLLNDGLTARDRSTS